MNNFYGIYYPFAGGGQGGDGRSPQAQVQPPWQSDDGCTSHSEQSAGGQGDATGDATASQRILRTKPGWSHARSGGLRKIRSLLGSSISVFGILLLCTLLFVTTSWALLNSSVALDSDPPRTTDSRQVTATTEQSTIADISSSTFVEPLPDDTAAAPASTPAAAPPISSAPPPTPLDAGTGQAPLTRNQFAHTDALDMTVSVIDVGQADSILVESEGHVMLVDAGLPQSGDTVVQYLRSHGIVEIDYLVATHPHFDHIGGMPAVLAAFDVENNVLAPNRSHSTKTYSNFIAAVDAEPGVTLEKPSVGASYRLGDATVEVLSNGDGADSLNNASIVLRVSCGGKTILLTGDIESAAERSLLSSGLPLKSDVLKVPHHGSRTSSTVEFLSAVQPQISLISCGRDNEYGHPHASTLNNLKASGTQVYRSDRSGTIVVDFVDDVLTVKAA